MRGNISPPPPPNTSSWRGVQSSTVDISSLNSIRSNHLIDISYIWRLCCVLFCVVLCCVLCSLTLPLDFVCSGIVQFILDANSVKNNYFYAKCKLCYSFPKGRCPQETVAEIFSRSLPGGLHFTCANSHLLSLSVYPPFRKICINFKTVSLNFAINSVTD
jgi:hypothetical protein